MRTTKEILEAAKAAVPAMRAASPELIDKALLAMADGLIGEAIDGILAANREDMAYAVGRLSPVMLDRLKLDAARVRAMADGIRAVAALPSPLGKVLYETKRPNGLNIRRVSVAMGVIGIIYESRPNVTSDAAALALKSGSAVVLRGGKDAFHSSFAIVSVLRRALASVGLPEDAVSFIEDTSRESANEMMRANGCIDLLIPRGGKGLIASCVENATVPCIQTGTGICHVYVDKSAAPEMALSIVENAKTSRPSVCNAEEVLLVDRAIAGEFLPRLYERLTEGRKARGLPPVEFRLDGEARAIIPGKAAGEEDFDTEFLDFILAVAVVSDVREAVAHIAAHSTHHSEAIVASDEDAIRIFTEGVDSAAVYVNASTRFTDGGEFGFGCEMGISTQKLHARGPLGLAELVTYKYIITGKGQTR